LRIAKFALGVLALSLSQGGNLLPPCFAKFISQHLTDGMNSVIKSGNKFPHSMERCRVRN
jgi:hypothetical protein